jgi:hypothetical protein
MDAMTTTLINLLTVTKEGGKGLLPGKEPSIRAVPKGANSSQGGILGRTCYAGLQGGDYIKVVVTP